MDSTAPKQGKFQKRNTGPREAPKATSARLFVSNLSWKTTNEGLRTYMETVGTVTHCKIILDSIGRSKGGALVEFESIEQAQAAIDKLTDTTLDERLIFVREDREPEKPLKKESSAPQTSNAVFVTNLPFKAKWQELKTFFADCGTIVRADTHSHPDGRSKGTGIVTFATPEGAAAAIAMAGQEMEGRAIGVREFVVYNKEKPAE